MKTYRGFINSEDAQEFNLPTDKVEMEINGYWVGAKGQHISSYVFKDGSHPEMAFTRDRHNRFYLEAIN